MAGGRLGRGHRYFRRRIAKQPLRRTEFDLVAERRRSAVRIDVVDIGRGHAGALHGRAHAAVCAVTVFSRSGNVIGVAAETIADDLGVNLRAALLGVLVLFEHHNARALAHYEAIAILVIGARRNGRIVVVLGGHRAQCAEPAHGKAIDGGFSAARNHHVGITVADHARAHADRVQAGCAGGDHREVGPLHAEHDREVARDHVDDGARNEEGRDLARAATEEVVVRILDHRQAADPRTDIDADAVGVGLGDLDAGVADRLDASGHAVVDEHIHAASFLGRQVGGHVEVFHLACDAGGEVARVETGDRTDAALAGDQVGPGFGNSIADRRDHAQTGDDDSTTRHRRLR
ncbi:MAG: hypothetical protein BWZ09_01267 [Alphaproteobacteria bacterium ADurb.BinA305]|nr:MAG: hypothetical protein BWZ09_01267 [Alphaproteobacteria bacterium ADurb.BinA305]